jgi:hypothetical protein
MPAELSSYALVGIDAVRAVVTVKGDHVNVVAARGRRVLRSVTLPAPVPEMPPIGSSVRDTLRKRAPSEVDH